MIYGTCRLPELLIKEQHGDQSLIRATVKGQRKVIKRLRDRAILTGNQSDFVHSTGNYLLYVRNHSLSTPSHPTWCLEALGGTIFWQHGLGNYILMSRAVMLPSLRFAWCAYGAYQHTEYCHCFALTLPGRERNLLCCQSPLKGLFQDNAAGPWKASRVQQREHNSVKGRSYSTEAKLM